MRYKKPRGLVCLRILRKEDRLLMLKILVLIQVFCSFGFLFLANVHVHYTHVPLRFTKLSKMPFLESESDAVVHVGNGSQETGDAMFLLILPYSANGKVTKLNKKDLRNFRHLKHFLSLTKEFDGATCLQYPRSHDREEENEATITGQNYSLESSWCSFMKRNWSVNIRNTGPVQNVQLPKILMTATNFLSSKPGEEDITELQTCNIAEGPFVIRKSVFDRIGGLHSGFGKATLLDFFLRSKGKMKIAKLANCAWSPHVTRIDRGRLEGTADFTDYSSLGNEHKVLRIVMPRRIEWTTCLTNWKYCPEKPYVKPQALPSIALPICCNAVLDQMLIDFVWAFKKLNLDYRVIFGTLLGAIRTKGIIPWTADIDFALPRKTFRQKSTYTALQRVLGKRYYVGKSANNLTRGHMHMAPYIKVDTASFFNGPSDLKGDALHGSVFDESVKDMLPIPVNWKSSGYVDFYQASPDWMRGSSTVTINGREYSTVKDVHTHLKNFYGNKYMEPKVRGRWTRFG